MKIMRVVGNMWATRKIPILNNKKLLLVQDMDPISGETRGKVMMAVCDKIDAGVGDAVLVMDEGSSAGQVLGEQSRPVRTFIFGVIDRIQRGNEETQYA